MQVFSVPPWVAEKPVILLTTRSSSVMVRMYSSQIIIDREILINFSTIIDIV